MIVSCVIAIVHILDKNAAWGKYHGRRRRTRGRFCNKRQCGNDSTTECGSNDDASGETHDKAKNWGLSIEIFELLDSSSDRGTVAGLQAFIGLSPVVSRPLANLMDHWINMSGSQ